MRRTLRGPLHYTPARLARRPAAQSCHQALRRCREPRKQPAAVTRVGGAALERRRSAVQGDAEAEQSHGQHQGDDVKLVEAEVLDVALRMDCASGEGPANGSKSGVNDAADIATQARRRGLTVSIIACVPSDMIMNQYTYTLSTKARH